MPPPLVYLLDDDESIIKLVKYRLRNEQLNVKSFSHPNELIEAIKIEYPDLVVSDVMMPEIDGIRLIEKLRELERLMPVILVTGKAAVDTAVRAMKSGAFEYLLKPINFEELKLAIGRAV
jgi:two-component system nitrogen regulation response regulator GlnG